MYWLWLLARSVINCAVLDRNDTSAWLWSTVFFLKTKRNPLIPHCLQHPPWISATLLSSNMSGNTVWTRVLSCEWWSLDVKGVPVSVLLCFLASFLSLWFSFLHCFYFCAWDSFTPSCLPWHAAVWIKTVVFLPGGMCVDKTKALLCIGQISEKVQVGRIEESTPPGSVKTHNTLTHATHTLDHSFYCRTGVPPLNAKFFYCSVSSYATP